MSTQIHNLKIYLDTCCLSRLNDNPTHAQIQQEAAAVETILDYCSIGQWFWSGNVDVFLTTDNGILRRAERFSSQLQVSVENPYEWLQEMISDEYPEKNRQ